MAENNRSFLLSFPVGTTDDDDVGSSAEDSSTLFVLHNREHDGTGTGGGGHVEEIVAAVAVTALLRPLPKDPMFRSIRGQIRDTDIIVRPLLTCVVVLVLSVSFGFP